MVLQPSYHANNDSLTNTLRKYIYDFLAQDPLETYKASKDFTHLKCDIWHVAYNIKFLGWLQ